MNSNDLKTTQKVLETLVKQEIDSPMTNYSKVNRLLKMIKEVDTLRRETWHSEKFGPHEEIIDNLVDFSADDIPF